MIIIGEKLNSFVPKVGRAIAERDADYLKKVAIKQCEAGAHYLDICPAVETDSAPTMEWLIDVVQSCCDIPLCIDSLDADLLIQSMHKCKKPGIINSASLVAGKADKIFPEIENTDWSCIVLLDHDSGIPKTPEESLEVFDEVYAKAKQFGIAPQRLFFDPLIDTLSTNDEALLNFATVCREIKKRLPQAHITSGLSNVSIGLPARKMVNASFLVLAITAGMDSAIIDPLNRELIAVAFATQALLGQDHNCVNYREAYIEKLFEPVL